MAQLKDNEVERALCHLFPSTWLKEQARQTGMVKRNRKVNPVALFWTLLLGFGIGKERDIASLRRGYESATGTILAASSFYDRFSEALVAFLQKGCDHALGQIYATPQALKGILGAFRDVLLIDATVLRLHDLLKNCYVACRTNHTKAAAKLHLVLSVLGVSEQKVKLTGERKHESKVWTVGKWVKDRLLLFDLGFFKYALFDLIDRYGGFFISRLKGICNPTIVSVHHGSAEKLLGRKLKEVLTFIKRDILDVEVEVSYKKRAYRGKRRTVTRRFRVVGIKNPLTRSHHLYITNIPVDILTAMAIAQVYSARWLIELVFKQLKSFYQLESLPSGNPYVVHALILSAILTMIVSRTIEQTLSQLRFFEEKSLQTPIEEVFPLLRLAAVLTAFSAQLLQAVLRQAGLKIPSLTLTQLILKEARDPNRNRDTLSKRALHI